MAKTRSTKSTLFQVLNQADCPLYVLNSQGEIQFANEALAAWLNLPLQTIEQRKCIWTTDFLADEALNQVRGLAAPPTAYRSDRSAGRVFRTAADRHLIWRRASFIRLNGTSDLRGDILVCVDTVDQSSVTDDSCEGDNPIATQVRDLIASFRTPDSQRLQLDHYFGISRHAQRLHQQINLACESSCNLLIQGPEGSCKEDLATAIHTARFGNDANLPLIHASFADAQSVQQTIVQARESSSQQGSEKGRAGAWILILGCDRLHPSAVSELRGFLELPNHQLQLIATCEAISQVDPDLLLHLGILEINIPPLADRKTDVPVIANLLLQQITNRTDCEFDEQATQTLIEHDWPGNLAELQQVVESVSQNVTEDLVTEQEFSEAFRHSISAQQIGGYNVPEIQLDQYLESIESELILRALSLTKNNKAKACKLLGISRAKLGRRIQHLKIGDTAEPVVFELEDSDES